MGIYRWRKFRAILTLLVLAASLFVSTCAALASHAHTQQARTCDLCLAGQLPWVQTASIIAALPPELREWRDNRDKPAHICDPEATKSCSRAPPA